MCVKLADFSQQREKEKAYPFVNWPKYAPVWNPKQWRHQIGILARGDSGPVKKNGANYCTPGISLTYRRPFARCTFKTNQRKSFKWFKERLSNVQQQRPQRPIFSCYFCFFVCFLVQTEEPRTKSSVILTFIEVFTVLTMWLAWRRSYQGTWMRLCSILEHIVLRISILPSISGCIMPWRWWMERDKNTKL